MEQKEINRRRNLTRSSLLKLGVGTLVLSSLTLVVGCPNNKIVIPDFLEKDYKQTDIIPLNEIEKAIVLYGKGDFDDTSFMMYVKEFEQMFKRQLDHVKPVTPQFFMEMEALLHNLYNDTEKFKHDNSSGADFLKMTLLRLNGYMLEHITFTQVSDILKDYYLSLDVRLEDYDYDYSLRVVETLYDRLSTIRQIPISRDYLTYIRDNIPQKSVFKSKDVAIGLRSVLNDLEDLKFHIEERVLHIKTLKMDFQELVRDFLANDSSFDLPNRLVDLKNEPLIHGKDYPYILGDGYVEVMPTETFTVRQYGKLVEKTYVFDVSTFKYRRAHPQWVKGSYYLKGGTMYMEVSEYKTEVEVLRLTEKAYLLGTEVLFME